MGRISEISFNAKFLVVFTNTPQILFTFRLDLVKNQSSTNTVNIAGMYRVYLMYILKIGSEWYNRIVCFKCVVTQ